MFTEKPVAPDLNQGEPKFIKRGQGFLYRKFKNSQPSRFIAGQGVSDNYLHRLLLLHFKGFDDLGIPRV